MKAEIDHKGTLKLSPESSMEAYAMKQWSEKYKVVADPEFSEISSSVLLLDMNWPRPPEESTE